MLHELLGLLEPPAGGLGWHDAVVEGFQPTAVAALAHALFVPVEAVCELIGLKSAALRKMGPAARLSAVQSAQLHRIAVAYHRLMVPLKDRQACALWLRNPQPALKGRIPILLLASQVGTEYVLAAISRIEPQGRPRIAPAAPDYSEHPGVGGDDGLEADSEV